MQWVQLAKRIAIGVTAQDRRAPSIDSGRIQERSRAMDGPAFGRRSLGPVSVEIRSLFTDLRRLPRRHDLRSFRRGQDVDPCGGKVARGGVSVRWLAAWT